MTEEEFRDAIRQIEEYSVMAEAFHNEAERLKQCVKEYMSEHCLSDVEVDGKRIRLQEKTTRRFDNDAFKRLYAGLYEEFLKPQKVKRLIIS